MKCVYGLGRRGWLRRIHRLVVLVLPTAGLLYLYYRIAFLHWPDSHSPVLNAGQLLSIVSISFLLLAFGGWTDGKKHRWLLAFGVLALLSVAAVVLWLLIPSGKGHVYWTMPLMFVNTPLLAFLTYRVWWGIRHFVGTVMYANLDFPGDYVLRGVPLGPSLLGPTGTILMQDGHVLSVSTCLKSGYIIVSPDGFLHPYTDKLFKPDASKPITVPVYDMTQQCKLILAMSIAAIRDGFLSNDMDIPQLKYDFILYLPYFDSENKVCGPGRFYHSDRYHGVRYMRKYEEYLEYAQTEDYFEGNAVFGARALESLISDFWESQSSRRQKEMELAAQLLAEYFGLVEV